jgi:membrane fusion protein (multidrug efflux system)
MNRKKMILSAVGTIAGIGVAYFLYMHLMYVTTDNAQVEAHTFMLASKVGGYIEKVNVSEGQKVKEGDVLIQIDSRDYENTLKQVRGEWTSIEARQKEAQTNFQRISSLYHKGAVAQQQYDQVSANYSEVKAKFDAVSAQLAQAELNLQNTKITAPMNGYIARKSAEEGQLAAPGSPLIGFVSATERWVTANFKETEIKDVRIGSQVRVDVDALPGHSYHGTVTAISSATGASFALLPPDNATGNFTKVVQRVPVKIQLEELSENDIENLRAGLSANVKVYKH